MESEQPKRPFKHSEVTSQVISAFYAVYNALGYGFLENVYQNALMIELQRRSFGVVSRMPIRVFYAGEVVGEYVADLVVAEAVILELKSAKTLLSEHEAQLLNYLKATTYEVGLLLNFGPKAELKRLAFENDRKEWWLAQRKSG